MLLKTAALSGFNKVLEAVLGTTVSVFLRGSLHPMCEEHATFAAQLAETRGTQQKAEITFDFAAGSLPALVTRAR
jgi:hypothetical protein